MKIKKEQQLRHEKQLKVKTGVKAGGYCKYLYYAGDIAGMQRCFAQGGSW